MSETAKTVDNGVKVDALVGAREALTNAPAAAQFKWRAACEWKNGTHSHSTVESFYGLGEEQRRKKRFAFDADHPEVFASEDLGATPVEYVLVGLASCLTAGIAAIAQYRNIQLKSVTATIEGDMDLAASSESMTRSATASRGSRSPTISMPTRAGRTSRRWSPNRRSARPSTTSSRIRRTSLSP